MPRLALLAVALAGCLGTACCLKAHARAGPTDTGPLKYSESDEALFSEFQHTHGKSYATKAETLARFAIFKANLASIREGNARYHRGEVTYWQGINAFTDLSSEEFKALYLSNFVPEPHGTVADMPPTNLTSIDWRSKGAVTPVKNQGQCGSCWAFSTTGSIEGAWAIFNGTLVALSEQQLMACSVPEGNLGCDGGLMDDAFTYVVKNGGLDSEADYGYEEVDSACDYVKEARQVAWINGYADVAHSDQQMVAAASLGPVSVAIEADQSGFQSYSGGIFNDESCGTQLDHGVLVVGFAPDYYLVKNSWGAAWGMEGYIKMARDTKSTQGMCGILLSASFPIVNSTTKPPHPKPTYTYAYGDPTVAFCEKSELILNASNAKISGQYCAPKCQHELFFTHCNEHTPPGTDAKPKCVINMAGGEKPDHCALECDPTSSKPNHGCPELASCTVYASSHICTYAA